MFALCRSRGRSSSAARPVFTTSSASIAALDRVRFVEDAAAIAADLP
jgi:hypothetical protein